MSRTVAHLTRRRGTIESEYGVEEVVPCAVPGDQLFGSGELVEIRRVPTLVGVRL
ncbi:hypothetical protein HTIA_1373 [Halorhabdus tiamatea SARL4B]|uniref:Uncharacterized protein n=1 Tax=Halorhabdus tiamatea SARL4B TaxID=1033806 RepID=S6D8H8_9EURY|nr:hypothetical protein HTIA_1373 [Halorhabdus tiamatea SARL4B]